MWIISVEISAGSAVKLNDKYLQEFRIVSKYKEIQCCFTNLSEFIEILTHALWHFGTCIISSIDFHDWTKMLNNDQ